MRSLKNNQFGGGAIIAVIIVVVLIGAGLAGYFYFNQEEKEEVTNVIKDIVIPTASASKFATYEEVTVDIDPQVPDYTVESDLSNIENSQDIINLEDSAKEKLAQNGFVVDEAWGDEFFSLYENNRYNYYPSFVTVDSILHNYHLFFDHLLRKVEEDYLIPKLLELNADMLQGAEGQYQELIGTDWENAAKRNVGFFAVASKLLDDSISVPDIVANEVNQELTMIEAHQGIEAAVVMNLGWTEDTYYMTPQGELPLDALKEDYSQYIPRGHYDKTDELKAYFKSMMWHGRMTFRMKNDDEIKSALLITLLLNNNDTENNWEALYEPTNFFVGKSDDITYYDFNDLIEKVYGSTVALNNLTTDQVAFTSFTEQAKELEPPQINSIPIFESALQPDRDEEILGFRFMGQRFVVDASIFQRLVCREVGNKRDTMDCGGTIPDSRMTPMGLDITSVMGSEEAYDILDSLGETEYFQYPENTEALREYVEGLDTNVWTQNLYWGWLYSLKPLNEEKGEGYPVFMQNRAWARKDLQSYLGSWTELKHDTILYAKQVYAEMGGGPGPEAKDDKGYVEPRPYVFARLSALIKMMNEGLQQRSMLSAEMADNLDLMKELTLSLKTIAEKELNGESLTEEEFEIIRSYGGQLEHFWLEVNKEDIAASDMNQHQYLNENPAAIVADVATDPNGQALEEATGHVDDIWVVVNVEGDLKVARGGVYSYYEFKWPLSDRLTDTKWRELLRSEDRPDRPDWTDSFFVPSPY